MPSRPKRPCNKIGCRNLTQERYCAEHTHLAELQRKDRHKYYDQYQRDKQAAAFYKSTAWERVRQQALIRDHGLCQYCLLERRITTADVVDHIKPLRFFWDLRLTLSNLQSLCHKCHMIKTAHDKRSYGG